jgi:glucose-6-phosphate 1-epimerase
MTSTTSPYSIEARRIDELDCWQVSTPHGVARIARQGAQLLSYVDSEGRPLIWLSEKAAYKKGQPLRGGVPVCWPWFGDYQRNPQSVRDTVRAEADVPAHGLVRGLDWDLTDQRVGPDAVEVVFTFDATRDMAPWRHPVILTLTMRFAESVTLTLSIRNLGEQALTQSLALHTYLAVGDSRSVTITGLEDVRYIDTVGGTWREKMQSGAIAVESETDRIYLGGKGCIVVHDPAWRRCIHVVSQHSESAVVWNPWIEKSRRLSQFSEDDWQRMVCVETARLMEDALVVAPGATGTVSVSLHTEIE